MSVTWFRFLKYLYALYFSKVQWWCQDKKSWILSAAAFGPGGLHKLSKTKGSNHASETGFCCLCRRPEETRQGQRQQPCLKKQDFAASAEDPKKLAKVKGSRHASEAGFCCFRRRREETDQGQRQQNLESWARLLPLTLERVLGFYLCPGDSSKQKISTTVLGIFVTFH